MAPCPLFCDKALRRVLGTEVTHLKLYIRMAFFKGIAKFAGNLAAPGVNKIELPFLARALFQSLRP